MTRTDDPRALTGSAGPSIQDLLDREDVAVPETLRRTGSVPLGTADIPMERYISRAWHDLEMEHMWKRVWQMACRDDDIPNIGDSIVYDIGDVSLIVVRTTDGVRAYHNSCLHRGRPLRLERGSLRELRCPFHGFTWSLAGELTSIPSPWDFPHLDWSEACLPQARVGHWAGWIFVNVDNGAEPLASYLGGLTEHWTTWEREPRAKTLHVIKRLPCNWKLGLAAFLESYHTIATHPQLLVNLDDVNTEYDVYPNEPHFNRMISAQGLSSPHLRHRVTEQEIFDSLGGDGEAAVSLRNSDTARRRIADRVRRELGDQAGHPVACTDSEAIDAIQYFVFPNFVPWGGYAPIVYRFRPNGNDPETSIMELILLSLTKSGSVPSPVDPVELDYDDPWSSVRELGRLAHIFEQDMTNLDVIQRGVRASRKGAVTLAAYQESRIRHFEQTLDSYVLAGRDGPGEHKGSEHGATTG
jgi:nitrite reductase/ring-hydroxylating ferredoxin subunit